MKRVLLAVFLCAVPALVLAAAPAPAASSAETGALLGGALIEALAAIGKPELGGVFTYINEASAPRAFADLVGRDPKAMKRYAAKLQADLKASGGASAWDHEVCATLVTYYAGPSVAGLKKPDAKRMKTLNTVVLSQVKELAEIVSARSR